MDAFLPSEPVFLGLPFSRHCRLFQSLGCSGSAAVPQLCLHWPGAGCSQPHGHLFSPEPELQPARFWGGGRRALWCIAFNPFTAVITLMNVLNLRNKHFRTYTTQLNKHGLSSSITICHYCRQLTDTVLAWLLFGFSWTAPTIGGQ